MIDALTALRLQLDWGADEAIADTPLDRFAPAPSAAARMQPQPPPQTQRPPAAIVSYAQAQPTATTLDELFAEIDAFAGCPLRNTATQTVRPDGNPGASLVLIGDAPGSDDDRSGRAYSGVPGQVLDRVLASVGLGRETMLLTTLVPWRPPGGRPLADSEVRSCLPFLLGLLGIVRPQRLVLLGAAPLRALTSETSTGTRVRGRWLPVLLPISLPTSTEQQPAPLALSLPSLDQWLRNASTKQQLWSDLIILRRALTPSSN